MKQLNLDLKPDLANSNYVVFGYNNEDEEKLHLDQASSFT